MKNALLENINILPICLNLKVHYLEKGSELQSTGNLLLGSLAQNSVHFILNVTKLHLCQKKYT